MDDLILQAEADLAQAERFHDLAFLKLRQLDRDAAERARELRNETRQLRHGIAEGSRGRRAMAAA